MVIFALVAFVANAFADTSYTFSVCSDGSAVNGWWDDASSANGQYTIGTQQYNISGSSDPALSNGDSCYGILWHNVQPQTSQDLGSLSVSGTVRQSYVGPVGVNDSGDAVGTISLTYGDPVYYGYNHYYNGFQTAVWWSPDGVVHELGSLLGTGPGGIVQDEDGNPHPYPYGYSSAWYINNSGLILGISETAANALSSDGGYDAVLWNTDGSIVDLTNLTRSLTGPDFTTNPDAFRLINQGQILGWGTYDGNMDGTYFLLNPSTTAPEPSCSSLLLLAALFGCFVRFRGRHLGGLAQG